MLLVLTPDKYKFVIICVYKRLIVTIFNIIYKLMLIFNYEFCGKFENKVKKADPSILDRLTSDNSKSYLLRLGLEGMKRIVNNKYQLTNS